jgi:hypothetical protein
MIGTCQTVTQDSPRERTVPGSGEKMTGNRHPHLLPGAKPDGGIVVGFALVPVDAAFNAKSADSGR